MTLCDRYLQFRKRQMKYLNYILSQNPIQPENFISDKRGLKELTIIVVLPASVVGLVFLAVLIPGAAGMDLYRFGKLIALRREKRANLRKYATAVIVSLGHEPTKDKINLLIAA